MKFADIHDIWISDLSTLSRRDVGKVYYERCRLVVSEAIRCRKVQIKGGVMDRDWLQNKIKCSASALRQNRDIRAYLQDKDQLFTLLPDTIVAPKNQIGFSVTSPLVYQSGFVNGRIIVAEINVEGKLYSIPTIHWFRRIDEEVGDWLRDLSLNHAVPLSSLLEYAKALRDFTRFRRRLELLWDEVSDRTIMAWRDHKRANDLQIRHINDYTDRVFAFYVWAEETGRLSGLVQLQPRHTRFDGRNRDYLITSKKVGDGDSRVWSKRLRDHPSKYRKRHTPTAGEVAALHNAVLENRHAERNSIMFSIAEQTGARRSEVLSLRIDQFPTAEQRDHLASTGGVWTIPIIRKRNKPGKLYMLPDLLRRIDLYIKYERAEIVERCRKQKKPVSNHLFLTDEALPLAPGSLTDLSKTVFVKAGIRNSSFHRLRARCADNVMNVGVDAVQEAGIELGPGMHWNKTILTRVADVLDHASLEALENYLNESLNSRIQRSTAQKNQDWTHAISEKERIIESLDRRITQRVELLKMMATLTAGYSKKKIAEIGVITDEILNALQL